MLADIGTERGLAPSGPRTTTERGPGGRAGSPFSARPDLRRRGAGSTDSPRTTQRVDRQMKRTRSANNEYLSADSANGVTPAATRSATAEVQRRRPNRDAVPVPELARLNGLPVQLRSVGRAQVGERVGAVLLAYLSMLT